MARGTKPTTDATRGYEGLSSEEDAARYVQDLRTAAPEDSQLAVSEEDEPIEASIVDDAARRAAQFVQDKGYGPNVATIIAYIAAHAVDTADLNLIVVEQMAARILSATNASEVLDPFQTVKGRDLFNRPLHIESCMFLDSTISGDGFPWYATLNVRDPRTGDLIPVTVGGEKLVMKAAVIDMKDGWPQVGMITSTPSRKDPNRTINDLVPAV